MKMDNRKTLIVGNWKMHLNVSQSSLLVSRLNKHISAHRDVEVVLAPSTLALQPLSLQIDRRRLRLAAQNANAKDEGALTGEVSFSMLHNIVHYVIIGHSERRIYFNESLPVIRDKVAACVRNKITPILCVGETADERRAGETNQVIHDQVVSALSNLTADEVSDIVIAYEPVWAISNFGGKLAKPADVAKAMSFIRRQIKELYGASAAESVRILYGGSVDDHIASGYLAIEDCDGALVGNASLNYHKFSGIAEAAHKTDKNNGQKV
jgi:triosephosphate isomerase